MRASPAPVRAQYRLVSARARSILHRTMRHPKAVEWEQTLKRVFDRIDRRLEDQYGQLYPLHPSRPKRGETSNPESDGLFNVGAVFTAGFGSEHGAGYIVETQMATLSRVPDEVRERIEEEAVVMLKEELARDFPGRTLRVSREGHVFKIHGDLSLGTA